jgi:hypothetical protein
MLLLTHITIEIQQYNLKPAFVGKHLKAEIMVDHSMSKCWPPERSADKRGRWLCMANC